MLTIRFRSLLIYPDVASFPLVIAASSMILVATLSGNLSNPVLVYLGRMSYGLYVFHALGLAIASFFLTKYSALHALMGLALTIMMAAASFHWLEKPFLKLKKRFTYVATDPIPLSERVTMAVSDERGFSDHPY